MSKQKNIKQIYADALYWAMSPKTKDQAYHLTRTQESVLRKLIHYDKNNSKISYSNEIIAKHTFLEASTIEKTIPSLNKIGYIRTITYQINDGSGKITSRRTININWTFIESILAEVPREVLPNNDEPNLNPPVEDKSAVNAVSNEEKEIKTIETTLIPTPKIPDYEQTMKELSFEKDIDSSENTGSVIEYLNKKLGRTLTFQPAKIISEDGTVYLDEVYLVENGKKKYYRKSQLKQTYPEIFEVAE